jgi:hypothetical protein
MTLSTDTIEWIAYGRQTANILFTYELVNGKTA